MSNNGMFIVTVFVSDSWGRSVVTFYTEFVGVGSFEVELMFFGGCAFWYFQAWVLSLYVAAITVCEWGWRRSLLLRLFRRFGN
jgi:hypothetical protein